MGFQRGGPRQKNSTAGDCFLGFLYILKIVWLYHAARCAPASKEKVANTGDDFKNPLYFGVKYKGFKEDDEEEEASKKQGLDGAGEDLEGLKKASVQCEGLVEISEGVLLLLLPQPKNNPNII